jgi:hypothetical protein
MGSSIVIDSCNAWTGFEIEIRIQGYLAFATKTLQDAMAASFNLV